MRADPEFYSLYLQSPYCLARSYMFPGTALNWYVAFSFITLVCLSPDSSAEWRRPPQPAYATYVQILT